MFKNKSKNLRIFENFVEESKKIHKDRYIYKSINGRKCTLISNVTGNECN